MLSASLIHDIYKGHQMAIMLVKFQFQKVSNRINMISMSFSLTVKGYRTSIINLNLVIFSAEV